MSNQRIRKPRPPLMPPRVLASVPVARLVHITHRSDEAWEVIAFARAKRDHWQDVVDQLENELT